MSRLALAIYFVAALLGIIIFVYDTIADRGRWKDMIFGIGISLIPVINAIVVLWMLIEKIDRSPLLNKRVRK